MVNQAIERPTTVSTIDEPSPNDVLCGRGKDSFHHQGNYRFRALIAEHAETYKMASAKKQKMQVVTLLADLILAKGGRFLVRSGTNWVDGGASQGRKKIGHAFRDALRGRVKCVTLIMNQKRNSAVVSESSSSDSSSDEFEADSVCSLSPEPLSLEPSQDWWNPKVDTEFSADLAYFLEDLQ